ncbi:MAG: pyridoxamine 5'-phosphate oxidase family protein [Cyanobacteria bacterium J06621_15]
MSYHSGEIAVQNQAGVGDEAQKLSSVLHNCIPSKAKEFLSKQYFAAVSSVDKNGKVWADFLLGKPGFIEVLNEQKVQINPISTANNLLYQNLLNNPQIGILVIDLENRRRLRINGKAQIDNQNQKTINIEINQVFFNCPKYIQKRHLETSKITSENQSETFHKTTLSDSDKNSISQSDTFFIASYHPEIGADASHRGGNPGFVKITSGNKLIFPDYAGNNMFQTFGNFAINPNAGILFIDFENGHTLQLTGKAKIVWDAIDKNEFPGAERLVEFDIEEILEIRNAINWNWKFGEYSPFNP